MDEPLILPELFFYPGCHKLVFHLVHTHDTFGSDTIFGGFCYSIAYIKRGVAKKSSSLEELRSYLSVVANACAYVELRPNSSFGSTQVGGSPGYLVAMDSFLLEYLHGMIIPFPEGLNMRVRFQ